MKFAQVFLILLTFFCSACTRNDNVTVSFVSSDNKTLHSAKLEVANTVSERATGLMNRRELAEDAGMIFVFNDSAERSFWMKNTYVALDMLFVAEDLTILGIIENVPILNEKGRGLPVKSKYVVELPAGTCQKLGIVAGNKISLNKELKAES